MKKKKFFLFTNLHVWSPIFIRFTAQKTHYNNMVKPIFFCNLFLWFIPRESVCWGGEISENIKYWIILQYYTIKMCSIFFYFGVEWIGYILRSDNIIKFSPIFLLRIAQNLGRFHRAIFFVKKKFFSHSQCSQSLTKTAVKFCSYFEQMLRNVGPGVDEVELLRDGTWSLPKVNK